MYKRAHSEQGLNLEAALATEHPMVSVAPSTNHVRIAVECSVMDHRLLIPKKRNSVSSALKAQAVQEAGVVLNSYAPTCIAFTREVPFASYWNAGNV